MNSFFNTCLFIDIGQIERQQQKEKDKENEEQEKLLNIYTIPIPERNSLQKLMDTAKNKNAK